MTVRGTVVAAESGVPLPFSIVALLPAVSERFTDHTGAFTFPVAPGSYRLRVRQIGYTPLDTVLVVRADSAPVLHIALLHLAVQLPPVTVLGTTACVAPGPPDPAIAPELTVVFGQVIENARRFELLADSYPYRSRIERAFTEVDRDGRSHVSKVDTILEYSEVKWRYEPGKIVGTGTGQLRGERLVRLPTLPDFADSAFVHAHCFRLVGRDTLEGGTYIRVDFEPAVSLRSSDVQGTAYLDSATFQIRYTAVRLTRPGRVAPGIVELVATSQFREVVPGILLHDRVRAVTTLPIPRAGSQPIERIEQQRLLEVHFLRPLIPK